MAGAVLAHQGGLDEIVLLVGPILVVMALLRLAKHRVQAQRSVVATSSTTDHQQAAAPEHTAD